ncbi:MFS transporter [Phycisphaerales bacterium AB-hyl4]|uniref:MFS transporter n=1 Tax=Natronomicrosphaera hydrolytica TaxID=3242702 RepID=A0ABV4UAM0_9BACT
MTPSLASNDNDTPSRPSWRRVVDVYFNRRMLALAGLGFAGGLPLLLSSATLLAWLSVAGIRPATIGLFSLAVMPYAFKFVVAPLMDRYVPPMLGRRRGWLLITQTLIMLTLLGMAVIGPNVADRPAPTDNAAMGEAELAEVTIESLLPREQVEPAGGAVRDVLAPILGWLGFDAAAGISPHLWLLAAMALLLATFSAMQDVVGDAYRTDILAADEVAAGAAVWVAAYRTAMIITSGGTLMLAPWLGWPGVYMAMAGLMLVGVAASLLGPEPSGAASRPASLIEAVYRPVVEFIRRFGWQVPAVLLVVALFRLPEELARTMRMTLLLQEMNFSETDVGIAESASIALSILGAFIGGALVVKLGLIRSLLIFGAAMALTNAGYWLLYELDGGRAMMFTVSLIDSFALGLVTAGFLGFLMSLCDKRFSAFQFALLTSLMRIVGAYLGAYSGGLVEDFGYGPFFLLTVIAGAPALLLLLLLRGLQQRADATD